MVSRMSRRRLVSGRLSGMTLVRSSPQVGFHPGPMLETCGRNRPGDGMECMRSAIAGPGSVASIHSGR